MTTSRFIAAFAAALSLCPPAGHAADFTVTSHAFASGTVQPAQFSDIMGCTGGNLSPDIHWSNAPEGTKSFVVTIYDKDAPTGSGWWHWNVVNIPATVQEIKPGASTTGAMPVGALEIKNDYGVAGFGGACPPPGEVHRYIFTVHALGVEKLDLPAGTSNALTGFMIGANTLGTAKITAVYNR